MARISGRRWARLSTIVEKSGHSRKETRHICAMVSLVGVGIQHSFTCKEIGHLLVVSNVRVALSRPIWIVDVGDDGRWCSDNVFVQPFVGYS